MPKVKREDQPITGPYPDLARIVREALGSMSFQVAARKSGVNRNTIFNMWHGDRASVLLTVKFADAFGISREKLLEASDYPGDTMGEAVPKDGRIIRPGDKITLRAGDVVEFLGVDGEPRETVLTPEIIERLSRYTEGEGGADVK